MNTDRTHHDPEFDAVAAALDRLGEAERADVPPELAERIAHATAPPGRPSVAAVASRHTGLWWMSAAAGLALLAASSVLLNRSAPVGSPLAADEIERSLIEEFDLDEQPAVQDEIVAFAESGAGWWDTDPIAGDLALANAELSELESMLADLTPSEGGSL